MAEELWILEIYSDGNKRVFRKIKNRYDSLIQKENRKGHYWIAEIEAKYLRAEEKFLRRKGIRFRKYKKEWERSSDYRRKFLKSTAPPYRCRYCNRRLKTEFMQVDHLIPVSQVKKSSHARRMLVRNGCKNVNDLKNLVPSCGRCNMKKGDTLGIWYIRGKLGIYRWYWRLIFIVKTVFLLTVFFTIIFLLIKYVIFP